MNLLRLMDIVFIDKIGHLLTETLSAMKIILRRVQNNSNIFMGGAAIISTLDQTQLN